MNIVNTATGPTEVPRLVDITLGPPTVFLAELLPGQIPADVRGFAHRLAGSLGAVALRINPAGCGTPGWPGIALLSAPGVPLRRFRAPHTPYADYYAEVTAAPAQSAA